MTTQLLVDLKFVKRYGLACQPLKALQRDATSFDSDENDEDIGAHTKEQLKTIVQVIFTQNILILNLPFEDFIHKNGTMPNLIINSLRHTLLTLYLHKSKYNVLILFKNCIYTLSKVY